MDSLRYVLRAQRLRPSKSAKWVYKCQQCDYKRTLPERAMGNDLPYCNNGHGVMKLE